MLSKGRSSFDRWALCALVISSLMGCRTSPSLIEDRGRSTPDIELGPFTRIYGPLRIEVGDFSAASDLVPWSGYWHPLSRIDARSALQKYDYLTGSKALEFEEDRIRNEGRPFLPWEGRCDAWSFSSIFVPEPLTERKVVIGDRSATFSVAEQKALWIYSHESVSTEARTVFGLRNNGDSEFAYNDFSPAEFHRVLQVVLRDGRRPFIMDRDPRPPVWNTPVFGARVEIIESDESPNRFKVTAWIQTVFPYDEDLNSTVRISPVLKYTYELDAYHDSNGWVVFASRWTGISRSDHPDFVTVPSEIEGEMSRSYNPEIQTSWLREHF